MMVAARDDMKQRYLPSEALYICHVGLQVGAHRV